MIKFSKFNEAYSFENKGMIILEIDDLFLNESNNEIDNLLLEAAEPDMAMSKVLKKDVVSMSKTNLTKITDTFVKLVKQEYSKNAKTKQRYLGRVRFLNDSGMTSEYPILTMSKEAETKIADNAAAGKSRSGKLSNNQIRVMINKKNGWRIITTDRVLGLVFRGKLYTLKDSDNTVMTDTQSSSLLDFADKSADIKAIQVEKLRNYLMSIGITDEKDLPKITTKDEIKKGILNKITDNKVKGIIDLTPTIKVYSISITGYNYKTREVTISIKLNLNEIIQAKFGTSSIKLSDNPVGITKAQWKLNVSNMKDQIIADIQSYNFQSVKIGTKYINIEVKG